MVLISMKTENKKQKNVNRRNKRLELYRREN